MENKPQPAVGTSILSRAWEFVTDEAAYADAVATQDPAVAMSIKQAPRPQTNVSICLEGDPPCGLHL